MTELSAPQLRQIQLNILKTVDLWCREHSLRCFLAYGTLLGAVRHQGYIPWDDDIDLMMPRADYERFISSFNTGRSDSLRALHWSLDPDFPFEYCKVHDSSTLLRENTGTGYSMGVNIDVFVIDNAGESLRDAQRVYSSFKREREYIAARNLLGNELKHRPPHKALAVSILKKRAEKHSLVSCTSAIDRLCRDSGLKDDSEYAAVLCQSYFSPGEMLRREWLQETAELPFEGSFFTAPLMYDEILSAWYGDYMELPPPEERVTHHDFKAYSI